MQDACLIDWCVCIVQLTDCNMQVIRACKVDCSTQSLLRIQILFIQNINRLVHSACFFVFDKWYLINNNKRSTLTPINYIMLHWRTQQLIIIELSWITNAYSVLVFRNMLLYYIDMTVTTFTWILSLHLRRFMARARMHNTEVTDSKIRIIDGLLIINDCAYFFKYKRLDCFIYIIRNDFMYLKVIPIIN